MQMHRSEQFEYKCVLKLKQQKKNFVVLISRYLFKFVHFPVHDTFQASLIEIESRERENEKVFIKFHLR